MNKTIIAICGKKRCGKDTAANYLQLAFEYKNIKLASKLKDTLKVLFDLNDEQIEGHSKDDIITSLNITPRKLMQWFGTEIMQFQLQKILPNQGRRFWIDQIIKTISSSNHNKFVISDLRFHHEIDALLETFPQTLVLRIERDLANAINDDHKSEQEFLNISPNYVIHNNASLDEFQIKLNQMISIYLSR
jgi:dephospho-CoA kinase